MSLADAAPAAPRRRGVRPVAQLLQGNPNQLSLAFDSPAAPAPAAPAPRPAGRSVVLAGDAVAYQLRRARRKSIGFQIDDRGLTVSAPRWVSLRDIEAAILEKERWIRSRLEQWQQWRRAKRELHRLSLKLPRRARARQSLQRRRSLRRRSKP